MPGLEGQAARAFLREPGWWLPVGLQDLLGWAQPLVSGEPGGGWAECGRTGKLQATWRSSWELVTSQAEREKVTELQERGQDTPACSQITTPRATAIPQWPWGGHGRGPVVTER